jgi:ParB-like nuclease domain
MSDDGQLPAGLALAAVDRVQPSPIQPHINFSVDLIEELASSMRAGRHQPLLEVEPAPGAPGRYQIVCGEQRWRAPRAAGLTEVLLRLHRPLGYFQRLEKQYQGNRLRADLVAVDESHCLRVPWNQKGRAGRRVVPGGILDVAGRPLMSGLAAGTVRAVARLAPDASTVRAAQLSATRDLFGHHLHLLFCREPAGAIPEVAALGAGHSEEPHIQRLQLSPQSLELFDLPSRRRDLVCDEVPDAVAFVTGIGVRAGQELPDLSQRQAKSFGPLEELEASDRLHAVDPVASLSPLSGVQQTSFLVVAQRRGQHAEVLRQHPNPHRRGHVPEGTSSTGLEGQALLARRCLGGEDVSP